MLLLHKHAHFDWFWGLVLNGNVTCSFNSALKRQLALMLADLTVNTTGSEADVVHLSINNNNNPSGGSNVRQPSLTNSLIVITT